MPNIWFESKILAARRRLALRLRGDFDPYPARPATIHLSPSERHAAEYDAAALRLSWRNAGIDDPAAWQAAARDKLRALTGHTNAGTPANAADPVTHRLPGGLVREARYLRLGAGHHVPIHLVWNENQESPRPVMLCLHGTNTGIHLAWGEKLMPPDPVKIARGADYARQAVDQGYVALCIEQSCFGERQERHLSPRSADPCIDAANHALLLGRTLLGERTSDVSAVIDWLLAHANDFPVQVDPRRLMIVGDSSGGTTALFATALDERIGGVIAGSCAGLFRDTIARRHDPSGQNVIPGILEWMEFDDVVGLCAPRPTLLVAGRDDHAWPAAGGTAVANRAAAVFDAFGAADKLRAITCEGGHRFYPDAAWPAFAEFFRGHPL